MVHELKTAPEYFQGVYDETKLFEIRYNDRDYKVGDILHLREYVVGTNTYTGRSCLREVLYVFEAGEATTFGILPGWCVMAIKPVTKEHTFVVAQYDTLDETMSLRVTKCETVEDALLSKLEDSYGGSLPSGMEKTKDDLVWFSHYTGNPLAAIDISAGETEVVWSSSADGI